jgi:hypothetical protein
MKCKQTGRLGKGAWITSNDEETYIDNTPPENL